VEGYVRRLFALGSSYKVTVGDPTPSKLPGFQQVVIEVQFQDSSDQAIMHVSPDGRLIVRGDIFDTTTDPFAAARAQIKLDGRPFKGPADAAVEVVEYGDFQCPSCRQLYLGLKQLVPKFPQVKFVFKDFPLEQIHPWARNAANAGYCALQKDQATFWKMHDLLFDNQPTITAENHWEKLQDFATQVGLDPAAFRACLTADATKAAIDAAIQEAMRLRVANTPTLFINGRRLVTTSAEQVEQILQYELSSSQPTPKP